MKRSIDFQYTWRSWGAAIGGTERWAVAAVGKWVRLSKKLRWPGSTGTAAQMWSASPRNSAICGLTVFAQSHPISPSDPLSVDIGRSRAADGRMEEPKLHASKSVLA